MPGLLLPSQQSLFVPPSSGGWINPSAPLNRKHPLVGQSLLYFGRAVSNPGWWGGSQLYDLTRQNDGTITGTGVWTDGPLGKCLYFDGATNYVTTTNFADNLQTFTVSVWMNSAQSAGNNNVHQMLAKSTTGGFGTGAGWFFGMRDAGATHPGSAIILIQDAGGNHWVEGQDNSNATNSYDGKWHHICLVVSSITFAGLAVYVDGVPMTLANLGNSSNVNFSNSNNVMIGRDGASNAGSDLFFQGKLSDPMIWNRALSAAEVAALYLLSQRGYPGMLNYLGAVDYPVPSSSPPAAAISPWWYYGSQGIGGGA